MAVIDEYVAARKARDFKAADEIRAKMRAEGIVLEVRRDGTVRQRGLRLKERAESGREEIGLLRPTESKAGASQGARLKAWSESLGLEGRKAAQAIGKEKEQRRLAICAATRAAVAAGVYENPPLAGSLGFKRALDVLLGETAEGREVIAEATRHTGRCMRRVPDRPQSVGCSCEGGA